MSVGRDDLEQGIKGLLQSAVKEDLYKIFFCKGPLSENQFEQLLEILGG